tara:strand:+ start:79 stop:339 length:261 start_codon:yes stop_codon:yes gene_type:complete
MNKKNVFSIDVQRKLVRSKLQQVINLSADSDFDVETVVDAFLHESINLAYKMSSHHQIAEELIADKILDAKVEYMDYLIDGNETIH